MAEPSSADYRGTLGRYALFGEIAAGGMASVHLARLMGSVGFARTVAIKRLHPHLAKDPDFVAMFLEEARLAARVRHANVVSTLDVVDEENELFLVMEYVAGESLSRLVRKSRETGTRIPPRYVVGVVCGALEGLHAAHEATSERGAPLGIVHRDVSPQNIHVGLDGVARVLDFGIAKATNRVQETRTDQIKGKVAYMSPEQLAKGPIDRRADVYSASVVLWEALTNKRLFKSDDIPSLVYAIMNDAISPPSAEVPELPPGLDDIVMRGLDRDPERRWASTREMAVALEDVLTPAPPREIGEWVRATAGDSLAWRIELVHRIESQTSSSIPPPPPRIDSPLPQPVQVSGVVKSALVSRTTELTKKERRHAIAEDERATVPLVSSADPAMASDPGPVSVRAEQRSRRAPLFLAIAVLLLAGGALAFRLLQLQRTDATSAHPAAAPPAAPEHEPAISLEASRVAPSASASTSTAPPVSATPVATATVVTAKPKPLLPPDLIPTSSPPKPASNDCDDPFTVDAKGQKRPKPHCFRR